MDAVAVHERVEELQHVRVVQLGQRLQLLDGAEVDAVLERHLPYALDRDDAVVERVMLRAAGRVGVWRAWLAVTRRASRRRAARHPRART